MRRPWSGTSRRARAGHAGPAHERRDVRGVLARWRRSPPARPTGRPRSGTWLRAQLRHSLDGHREAVVAVAFAPDGRTLATSCRDGKARLWDVAAGTERRALLSHAGPAGPLVFLPDGRSLHHGRGRRVDPPLGPGRRPPAGPPTPRACRDRLGPRRIRGRQATGEHRGRWRPEESGTLPPISRPYRSPASRRRCAPWRSRPTARSWPRPRPTAWSSSGTRPAAGSGASRSDSSPGRSASPSRPTARSWPRCLSARTPNG